jgi:CelD/BcsL family acetyltransferase involved in cellulose biosynthesis
MGVRLRTYRDLTQVGGREGWSELRARPPASLTASRGWLSAAALTVDRGSVPYLLAVEDDDRLLGLMTLTLDRDERGARVRFAASPNNDLCDVLSRPGCEQLVGDLILAELARIIARGWSIALESVDPSGLLFAAAGHSNLLSWSQDECAPTVDLQGPWRTAVSGRRGSQWARRMRRLRQAGAVELRQLEGDGVCRELSSFLTLREARRAAKGYQDLPPTAFLTHVVNELAPTGNCILMELLVDGAPVAADLYLIDRPVALMWLRGLDPRWRRFPCGHLLLQASAESLSECGFDTLDLGRGDEPYKALFGAERRVLLRATA